MKKVQFGELTFVPSISCEQIAEAVKAVAERINTDYAGKEPVFLVVLNGAFMFASDLLKNVDLTCTVSFIKLASYSGTQSTGDVREVMGLDTDLHGKDVIIVEDIVDSGLTMHGLLPQIKERGAASVEICAFVHKPEMLQFADAKPKYVGMNIPKRFIIGYGLDIDGKARNLPEVYELAK